MERANMKMRFSFYPIHCVIILFLLFGFNKIPASDPLTSDGMAVLGILAGMIYGWTTVGLIWPSIFGMIAMLTNNLLTPKEMFMASFGNDTVWMIVFLLIVSAMIDEAKLTKVIAMWFVTKETFHGKPWLFSLVFLFATFLLSAIIHVMAAIVICWSILYQICAKLDYEKREPWSAYMVLGIVVAGMLGTALFPFKPLPYSIMAVFTQAYGYVIDFSSYMAFSSVVCLLTLFVFILVGKFILRIDVTKLRTLNREIFEQEDFNFKLTVYQKIAMATLVVMTILLLVPSILPDSVPVLGFFKAIGLAGTMMFITAVLVMVRIDEKPLLSFEAMANKGIQWPTILLVASLMPTASFITSEFTGIQPWLTSILSPIFLGHSPIIYIILLVVLMIVLTNYLNNALVGALFVLITTPITVGIGVNPSVMAVIIAFSVHLALVSPAGSIWSALLFSNLEWISMGQIYKYAIPNLLIMAVVIVCIGYPLGTIFF